MWEVEGKQKQVLKAEPQSWWWADTGVPGRHLPPLWAELIPLTDDSPDKGRPQLRAAGNWFQTPEGCTYTAGAASQRPLFPSMSPSSSECWPHVSSQMCLFLGFPCKLQTALGVEWWMTTPLVLWHLAPRPLERLCAPGWILTDRGSKIETENGQDEQPPEGIHCERGFVNALLSGTEVVDCLLSVNQVCFLS